MKTNKIRPTSTLDESPGDIPTGSTREAPGRRMVIVFVGALCLMVTWGCATKENQMGVQNKWRSEPAPAFERGHTTQSQVMAALGPPSQVIGLHDQTLFYYLREQLKTKSVFLIFYNQTRERVSYDRAIFFFDKQGLLTDFALSEEAIPREK
jgi:outer membrane protein assembly factor BamE (lipoprotein component of BamABCDE complex)